MTVRREGLDLTLMVIAKAPVPGRVKTRLCPPATPAEAARVAQASLEATLAAAIGAGCRRNVIVLEGAPGPWLPPEFRVMAQRGHGLDGRLASAFALVEGPAFLIGMDTPQITSSLIRQAAHALTRPGTDAVLGPAVDGGWWGIGLRRPDPRVFLGVPMSRSFTRRAQIARLEELELLWTGLPLLQDVDSFADAQTVAASIPSSRFARVVQELSVAAAIRAEKATQSAAALDLPPLPR